jgi:hypothetical protein
MISGIIAARRGPEILIARHMEGLLDAPKIGFAGYVKWELVRNGKVIKDSGGFHPNVITNIGMNRIAVETLDISTAQAGVGSGATAPAITDIALQAAVGTKVGRSGVLNNAYVAGPPDYWFRQHQYKFLEANANGNLSEFATFSSAGGTPIFSRQLLKDNLGNPTVITKTATDQLWITYEIRCYPPTADVNSVVTISGVNYDVTTRPMQVSSADAWGSLLANGMNTAARVGTKEANVLLARTGVASNFTSSDGTQIAQTAYVADSYFLEMKDEWSLTDVNYATGVGAIASVYGNNFGFSSAYQCFQHVFTTTKIPKTNTKKLDLFLRRSWARYP